MTGWSISLNTGKYHEIGQAVSLSRIKEMFRYSDKDNTNILDDKAYK